VAAGDVRRRRNFLQNRREAQRTPAAMASVKAEVLGDKEHFHIPAGINLGASPEMAVSVVMAFDSKVRSLVPITTTGGR
jgi:hypothetical protein